MIMITHVFCCFLQSQTHGIMVIEADDDTQKHLVECKSFRPLGAENNISLFCVILVLLVNVMEDGRERGTEAARHLIRTGWTRQLSHV